MTLFSGSIWKRIDGLFLLVFLGVFLVGCSDQVPAAELTPTEEVVLVPYVTTTPSSKSNQDVSTQNAPDLPTSIPTPTPTPQVYEVIENDTLTGIANRHSVPLEELIVANPGIDPNYLTIGLTLTIPMAGVPTDLSPVTTPIPLTIHPPKCYALSEISFQCMSVVENDTPFDVENVTAKITMQVSDDNWESNTAYMPLDLLHSGQKAAVSTSFPYPLPKNWAAYVDLLTVIPVPENTQRYLQSDLQIGEAVYSLDRLQSTITGKVSFPPEQPEVGLVWVSAFAFDAQNEIVGIRKWVADEKIESKEWINFVITVYSLGDPIENVDVLIETRPKQE